MRDTNATRRAVTAAAERVTGRRFCASCQREVPIASGVMRATRRGARFVCMACVNRMEAIKAREAQR